MRTHKLPGRGWAQEVLECLWALSPAAGASVRQPQESYFGPRYVNRSPAGSWHEHTSYLLFHLFPSYAKDQQHRVIYTFIGDRLHSPCGWTSGLAAVACGSPLPTEFTAVFVGKTGPR